MKKAGMRSATMKDRVQSIRPEKVRDYAAEIGMEIVPANRQAPMWPPQAQKVIKQGMAKSNRK